MEKTFPETIVGHKRCPKCGAGLLMVEYSLLDAHHYDGVSEIACGRAMRVVDLDTDEIEEPTCDYRVGRWCGKELKKGEVEPRFCKGEEHPKA